LPRLGVDAERERAGESRLRGGKTLATCEEKWALIVPGKKFTAIVHTTYELLECYGDVEDCVKYESLLKPLTYRVVAIIEE
jgi:hypothetical protein